MKDDRTTEPTGRRQGPVSRLANCFLDGRPGELLFDFGADGRAVVNLDGYAVVPKEKFLAGGLPRIAETEAGWPCPKCGLMPTENGHDPCIANLPGVAYACCGHGIEAGYVKFEDGRVIHGAWDHV